ncbi:trigger factor [Massilibacteroides sp.]|uniref:trigger factor n=1 Tax=Massilibacteroides sp. TaxID=2034766 RepID=UPI0026108A08|nr:trigger factor [Massilibacteroides sp.]MDD4514905.1 trigger factor [Massilibacteroides sp.]
MNISLKNNDADNSGILKIEIVKADYAEKLEKSMRNFRQKVALPGFRKGMVPMGMVKKMHGTQLLVEEINKLVSESLFDYIRDEKLNILGEPMPNTTEQKELNFNTQEDFEFSFDLAFAPEIKVTLNKRDKLTSYQVIVDDEMVNKQIDSYRVNFGTYEEADDEIQEKDLLKGTLAELEGGAIKEGGILVEGAVLMPLYLKDEEEKAKFLNAKKNNVVVFNPKKAYEGANAEIASLLKIEKEQAENVISDFSFEISEVTRHKEAELNQELFDKVFDEGMVSNEEEFRAKVKEILAEQFEPQANYKFLTDARDLLIKKAGSPVFADSVLKRWLLETNKKKTEEELENEYPQLIEDLKYQLVKESIVKENDIKVEDADIEQFATRVAKSQFAQYGMMTVPEDVLAGYVKDMLKNKQTLQNIIDRVVEEKLSEVLKGMVKLEVKEVTVEEFNKLFS